jgi:hypothetical protein
MNPNHLKPFDAKSLLALDEGRIAKAIDMEMKKVFGDIIDRPCSASGKTKPRKMTIEIEVSPIVKEDKSNMQRWVVDHVEIVPKINSKLPAVTGGINAVKLSISRDGAGVVGVHGRWNPEIPDDLDQPSLFEEDPLDVSK